MTTTTAAEAPTTTAETYFIVQLIFSLSKINWFQFPLSWLFFFQFSFIHSLVRSKFEILLHFTIVTIVSCSCNCNCCCCCYYNYFYRWCKIHSSISGKNEDRQYTNWQKKIFVSVNKSKLKQFPSINQFLTCHCEWTDRKSGEERERNGMKNNDSHINRFHFAHLYSCVYVCVSAYS